MIATFMKVGTGLGPTGTVSNNGPVTHRVSTTVMNTSTSTPNTAHHFTGAGVRGASTTGFDVSAGLTSERVIVRFLSMPCVDALWIVSALGDGRGVIL
jgi:hypothetical protein